jgi:hypothetical protein
MLGGPSGMCFEHGEDLNRPSGPWKKNKIKNFGDVHGVREVASYG